MAPTTLPDGVWRGICFAHSWEDHGELGYGSQSSGDALDHLVEIGSDWVSVTPFGFMESTTDLAVHGEHNRDYPRAAETRQRLTQVVNQAHQRGLKVMLKPHIWIRGGKWRGRIQPTKSDGNLDWKAWWDSHDAWSMHYAALAEELDIAALVLGVELHTAVKAHPERLIMHANEVRRVYDGHITYAANWNEPVPLDVWKSLDSVGVQFYPPLTQKRGTFDEPAVRQALREQLDAWNSIAERAGKPLVITEVGYRAGDLAISHPNAWPEKMKATEDLEMQKNAYRVFFAELAATPQIGGVFLWKYFTNPHTDEEGPTGFSPRKKPAEAIIEKAFSRRSSR